MGLLQTRPRRPCCSAAPLPSLPDRVLVLTVPLTARAGEAVPAAASSEAQCGGSARDASMRCPQGCRPGMVRGQTAYRRPGSPAKRAGRRAGWKGTGCQGSDLHREERSRVGNFPSMCCANTAEPPKVRKAWMQMETETAVLPHRCTLPFLSSSPQGSALAFSFCFGTFIRGVTAQKNDSGVAKLLLQFF